MPATPKSLTTLAALVLVAVGWGCGAVDDGSPRPAAALAMAARSASPDCRFRGVAGLTLARGATPDAYLLSWDAGSVDGAAHLFASTSPDVAHTGVHLVVGPHQSSAAVAGLDPAWRWYFDVVDRGSTAHVAERRLPLLGALNFRDVGGYPAAGCATVRWGAFFRSDALGSLTPADVDYLGLLGLARVHDVRQVEEIAAAPDRLPPATAYASASMAVPFNVRDILTGRIHVDLDFMIQMQKYMVDNNAATIAGILRQVAEGPLPQAVHCTGGKDRTGVISALLLAALGVEDQVIAADFALSDGYLAPMMAGLAEMLRARGVPEESIQLLMHTPPVVVTSMLDYVRQRYGSVEAYLASGGLDTATLAILRARLLQ
jgi:protein-tyrosine phosphatase